MLNAQDYCDFATSFAAQRNDLSKAEYCYRMALAVDPAHTMAMMNLASMLVKKRPEEALWLMKDAAKRGPESAFGLTVFGRIFAQLERFGDARLAFTRALTLEDRAETHRDLGVLHMVCGRRLQAREEFLLAAKLDPLDIAARTYAAMEALALGEWQQGFLENETRVVLHQSYPFNGRPIWTGKEDIAGKTVLVIMEQGVGDAFMMVRYCKLLKERGARVLVWALGSQNINHLLRTCPWVDEVVEGIPTLAGFESESESPIKYDFHVPAMSLPQRFGTTTLNVPGPTPYFQVPLLPMPMPASKIMTIGLCWRGNPKHLNDRYRSIHDSELVVDFIKDLNREASVCSLQCPPDPDVPSKLFFDASPEDWFVTAQMIAGLDLIITVDTAVAHLAGALGRPTWLLLPTCYDWRWAPEAGEETTPWYRSLRLFRQKKLGDWAGVLARVQAAFWNRPADFSEPSLKVQP